MGKTSLLNNLGRLLRDESVPLFVDLQGPISQASSHAGLLYGLSRAMIKSAKKHRDLDLPTLERDKLDRDPFLEFDEWLDQVERAIRRWSPRGTALLALDEFEALDHALRAGQFEEKAVLGTLRNITQHRFKGFKVLISGSHSLEELQNWSSYMIGMQPLKIGYLEREYALGLIEKPVPDFELRYEPEASQRVLDLTRGHPFLVQLLCSEIVALKNEHPVDSRRIACLQDVEKALIYAIESGSMFFGDIEYNQVNQVGRDMLRFLAHQGEGAVLDYETLIMQCDNDEPAAVDAFALLQRRDVIEPAEGGYRFQVEMIRRWFAR
jgi:hypothetical protein